MLIEARKLTRLFPVERRLQGPLPIEPGVRDASFVLNEGEALGIVGSSGSGKTTLARLITGILTPQSGVIVYGPLITKPCRDIQLIPQNPMEALDPMMSIASALREPLIVHRYGGDMNEHIRKTIDRVHLDADLLGRRPRALSGGERQRAVILNPKIIVCDEPTASLDLIVQAQILRLLKDLKTRENISLIFISHDPDIIRFISEKTLLMKSGIIMPNT
jgi:peptide/nickel transport system ATP-binding protein